MTLIIEILEIETMLLFTDFFFYSCRGKSLDGWYGTILHFFFYFDAFKYFVPKRYMQKTLHSWYSVSLTDKCGKVKTSISQNADIPKFGGARSEAV